MHHSMSWHSNARECMRQCGSEDVYSWLPAVWSLNSLPTSVHMCRMHRLHNRDQVKRLIERQVCTAQIATNFRAASRDPTGQSLWQPEPSHPELLTWFAQWCAKSGHKEGLSWALALGDAGLSAQLIKTSTTYTSVLNAALLAATAQSKLEVMGRLLDHGADVHAEHDRALRCECCMCLYVPPAVLHVPH